VCSTNAAQPSRSSCRTLEPARATESTWTNERSSALAAYVPPSMRSAVPEPTVATIDPPVAAPSGKAA